MDNLTLELTKSKTWQSICWEHLQALVGYSVECYVVFSVVSFSPSRDVIRQPLAELPYEKIGHAHARWQILIYSIPDSDTIFFCVDTKIV